MAPRPFNEDERAAARLRRRVYQCAYSRKWYWANHDRAKELARLSRNRRRGAVNDRKRSDYRELKLSDAEAYAVALANRRAIRERQKDKVFAGYGGATCRCCGESERAFLTIDHMHGGGNEHRRQIGASKILTWLIKNNFPDGFQILCFNCNNAKEYSGGCPHQTKRSNSAAA